MATVTTRCTSASSLRRAGAGERASARLDAAGGGASTDGTVKSRSRSTSWKRSSAISGSGGFTG